MFTEEPFCSNDIEATRFENEVMHETSVEESPFDCDLLRCDADLPSATEIVSQNPLQAESEIGAPLLDNAGEHDSIKCSSIVLDFDQVNGENSDLRNCSRIDDSLSFGGKREDIQKEIAKAKADVEYYSKEVSRLSNDLNEGWTVDSILYDKKSALDSAISKLHDLERELSYVRD